MLTKKQYKFLKKVSKKETPCDELQENDDRICTYLLSKKFVETYLVCQNGDILQENAKSYYRISQDGEVELKLYKQENYRFWIPTVLSIIAIFASFLAVFTQNEDLWKFLQGLLQ